MTAGTPTAAASGLAGLAAAALRSGADAPFVETIEGETFLAHPPTPFLAHALHQVRTAIERAATHAGLGLTLGEHEPLVVADRYMVVPDLVVREHPDGPIVLVIELRSESTDRYALGLKRLAYQTAGIDEYWFVDPRAARLQRLWLEPGERDYTWPPAQLVPDELAIPRRLPDLRVPVADLFPTRTIRGAHR